METIPTPMTEAAISAVRQWFKDSPKCKEIRVTADGHLFLAVLPKAAIAHSKIHELPIQENWLVKADDPILKEEVNSQQSTVNSTEAAEPKTTKTKTPAIPEDQTT